MIYDYYSLCPAEPSNSNSVPKKLRNCDIPNESFKKLVKARDSDPLKVEEYVFNFPVKQYV